MRAAGAGLGLGLGDPREDALMIVPSGRRRSAPRPRRGRRRRAGCRTPGRRGALVRATRAAGSCSGGIEPPPGASSVPGSDGAPISVLDGRAEHPRHRLVGVQDHAVRVPDHDALLEGFGQRKRGRRERCPVHRPAPIRYPTPRTVQTKSGERGSSASLRRRLEMWTSTRWSSPNQFSPHTRSSSWARLNATRGSAVSVSSRSNSIRVRSSDRAVELGLAGGGVDGQRAERARIGPRPAPAGAGGAVRAAQHGLHAADELGDAERLRDVVVGAGLEADDLVELGVLRGEHQDVRVAELRARGGRPRRRRCPAGRGRGRSGRAGSGRPP